MGRPSHVSPSLPLAVLSCILQRSTSHCASCLPCRPSPGLWRVPLDHSLVRILHTILQGACSLLSSPLPPSSSRSQLPSQSHRLCVQYPIQPYYLIFPESSPRYISPNVRLQLQNIRCLFSPRLHPLAFINHTIHPQDRPPAAAQPLSPISTLLSSIPPDLPILITT